MFPKHWLNSLRSNFGPCRQAQSGRTARLVRPHLEVLEDRCLLTAGQALASSYAQIPLSFEVNQGQSDANVDYLARGQGYGVFLSKTDAVLSLVGADGGSNAVRMHLVGGDSAAKAEGLDKQGYVTNYLIGDPNQQHTGIANFGEVEYHQVYSGIDVIYYGNQKELEYDFHVAPRADPGQIHLAFDGATGVEVDADGRLLVHTSGGDLAWSAPSLYQETATGRQPVAGSFVMTGPNQVGFAVGAYDRSAVLVIDPTLIYSTFLGGNTATQTNAIAVDGAGHCFVTGYTSATVFPTTFGAFNSVNPMSVFVTELNSTGTGLVYSTFLGNGFANGIAVDSTGHAFITGYTSANKFPTTAGAFQTAYPGNTSVFVTELNSTGTALVYSTFLGANNTSQANGIAVDGAGDAFVTGYTSASNFPTTAGAFQTAYPGNKSVFVSELNPTGTALVYSTYLGGNGSAQANAIAVDTSGHAFVTGSTFASDFPTSVSAFQSASPGSESAFVTELNATGTALVYSTYLGGNPPTQANGIAVDGSGHAFVTGFTPANNFPTTAGAFQAVYPGSGSAFVTELNPTGTALVYSTYLGGDAGTQANGIAVDGSGHAFVTGYTSANNFPTTAGAFANPGIGMAFVTELNPSGTALVYSTYLGGISNFGINTNVGYGVTVDTSGHVFVTGSTHASDFPTTAGALQTGYPLEFGNVGPSGFVVRFDKVPIITLGTTNPTVYGQANSLTATVSSTDLGDDTPTGTVTFTVDGVPLIPVSLNAGTASLSLSNLGSGVHFLGASYSGSTIFDASIAAPLTQYVAPANTTTTLTPATISPIVGQAIAFNVAVTPVAPGGGTPTGTVAIVDAGITLISGVLSGGTASLNLPLALGGHSLQALYSGSTNYLGNNTTVQNLTVGQASVAVSVVSSAPSLAFGQPVTFIATVTATTPSTAPVVGTLTFTDSVDGLLGTVALSGGVATLTTGSLTPGPHTITATFNANTNYASGSNTLSLTVDAGPATHFAITAPTGATTGVPFSLSVTALDASNNLATGYHGSVHFTSTDNSAMLPINATLANGVATFSVTLNTSGNQTITATGNSSSNSIIAGTSSAITTRGLTVTSLTPTPTGFTATFSKAFVPSDLTLYGSGLGTVQDVTLVGAHVGAVSGSLIIDPSNMSVTFKATENSLLAFSGSAVLRDDTYTVTLVSGSGTNGFLDALGTGLDGASNGGHANYTTTFTTANSSKAILSIPDFARGPDGTHTIKVPSDTAAGIPVTLSNAASVKDVIFTLNFNPTLLTPTGAGTSDSSAAGSTFTIGSVTNIDATHAAVTFTYHNGTAQSGTVVLGDILATVPDSAAGLYKSKELLSLSSITVNGAAFTGAAAGGVHVNAYFGDVTGNGSIDGLDVATAATVAQGKATGFAAYQLLDPAIVGDVAGDISVDAGDVSDLAAFTVHLPTPVIPAIPTGLTITPVGADPTLSLGEQGGGGVGRIGNPSGMRRISNPSYSRVISVLLDDPHPSGSTGMTEAIVALTYDPSQLSVSPSDITLGSIPAQGTGWQINSVVDAATGQIAIELYSTTPITATQAGSLVNIAFHVKAGERLGSSRPWDPATAVQLVNSVTPGGQQFTTQVDDAQGQLVLSPGTDRVLVGPFGRFKLVSPKSAALGYS